jgi:3-deoxy-D-manno-octulosonic-acid transferase
VQELKTLWPQAAFTLTTGTETGQAVARRQFQGQDIQVCYFPLDVPWAVQRYLNHLRPHLFIGLDSEIWPNFLLAARSRGIPLALVNARLSARSFQRFQRFKRYLTDIIKLYGLVAAGSSQDYQRFATLGVPSARLHFTGNLKIDALLARREKLLTASAEAQSPSPPLTALLNLSGQPVWLAASTHPGEEEIILKAYQQLLAPYPSLLLILAPRHPERARDLGLLLNQRNLAYQLWHRLKDQAEDRGQTVVLVDTIGDLFHLYQAATVAFVGGSLVPHGGQNILEAAAWGLAPLYGPYLQNFSYAQEILEEAQAGQAVHDAATLAAAIQALLSQPAERLAKGARAHEALAAHQGAARRQARLVVQLLNADYAD